jgi:hypothetical protein
MWRIAALICLLSALIDPASAMDQSAMEETNCLMGCDSNQEHCMGLGNRSALMQYSSIEPASKSSRLRHPVAFSEARGMTRHRKQAR